MAISSIGIGSGLPLEELLENLRTSENQSLALIQSRADTVESRLSAYGTIKSSVEVLKNASDAMAKADTFGALKTSATGDAYTGTATNKAVAGIYNIAVKQLATSQSLRTSALTPTTQLAEGKVNIEIKLNGSATKTITLDKADTTLEGIVKAVNGDSSLGISATLINIGGEPPQSHLMFTAKRTGMDAAVQTIKVTKSDDGTPSYLDAIIGFESTNATNPLTESAAKNATIEINGIPITSQTNTVKDAIEGVTLTLTKTHADLGNGVYATDALTVSRDDSVTSKAVNAFVSAYNTLQGIIKTLSSYNVDAQKGSALTGDSLTRNIQNQIREALNVAGSSGAVRSLSQMGITTDVKDGTLKVDSTKLSAALKDNMVDVQNLFAGENGISKKLGATADVFIKSGGLISSASDSMTSSLKDLNKQYAATFDRIDAKMEVYRKQFSAMDSMVAQMNSVSSYLTQQLSMLGNLNEK
ncbi:flagellar hook-associated protein 2 [Pollutimonas subterranea]|uniref:Flagellar hook-associated protein 2 n=1 Tax=Pollutimonas subterranea TaxID=2045210 RepID=A0A2N4TYY9_9BURK|nr:flagellar filament capping protein FliD [Pollutimonas subterranea]PLC47983.1 flagellar hook-associated protein 2 [Pollutimonas subterranea]